MSFSFWIILAVCAVVLCVALSLARKINFGAGGGVESRNAGPRPEVALQPGQRSWPSASRSSARPTRTIPNEQAKRRAMWAKIVRKIP